jgi:hypothetical protein
MRFIELACDKGAEKVASPCDLAVFHSPKAPIIRTWSETHPSISGVNAAFAERVISEWSPEYAREARSTYLRLAF